MSGPNPEPTVNWYPDFHISRRGKNPHLRSDPQPQPIQTLFVAPDDGVIKTPDEISIPMPHQTMQYHGCESVPYVDFVSEQKLADLTKYNKHFFRNLLAVTVKHL